MEKVFVENTMQLVIRFDDVIVSNVKVHPNMIVLPAAGDRYSFQTEDGNENQSGFVDHVNVTHIQGSAEEGGVFRQRVEIYAYTHRDE